MIIKIILLLPSLVAAFCHYGPSLHLEPHLHRRDTKSREYSYQGITGPLAWHTLDPKNALCATGSNQSPINIIPGQQRTVSGASFRFKPDPYPGGAKFENLGHTVQIPIKGSITVDDREYELVQFHFHTPSEHQLSGEYYVVEVHFVAQTKDSAIAVLGFLVDIGDASDCISDVISSVLSNVDKISHPGDSTLTEALDFTRLQAHLSHSSVYQYNGSLTIPPCSENVIFNVVDTPLFMDVKAFRRLKKVLEYNSRYIQNAPGEVNLLMNAANTL